MKTSLLSLSGWLWMCATPRGTYGWTPRTVAATAPRATTTTANGRPPSETDRRTYLSQLVTGLVATTVLVQNPAPAAAEAAAMQDSLDVSSFLRTGIDPGGNMGVSSQAGKSRPQTGVVFRDGSDIQQDTRSGNVLAEVLTGTKADPQAIVVTFASPWKLQTGSVFDVECRDPGTGDNVFLAVTKVTGGKALADLPSSFFLDRLFDPTGRFSFYGAPTDIKVKASRVEGKQRFIELGFSNLSQSTAAEIPRKALLVATIPEGTDQAIMLVGSTTAKRWRKGGDQAVRETVDSFRATVAPKSSMKIRAKRDERFEF
jgi:hypothetical protein